MGAKDLWKSIRSGRRSDSSRSAASPFASPGQSAEVHPREQEERQGTKAPSSSVTEPHAPSDLIIAEATRATEKGPEEACSLESASLKRTAKSLTNTAQTQAQPVERQTGEALGTELTELRSTALSKSQELWNAAYDSLEEGKDTAELVKSYLKILTTVLGTRLDVVSDADVSANLKDPTKRQMFKILRHTLHFRAVVQGVQSAEGWQSAVKGKAVTKK